MPRKPSFAALAALLLGLLAALPVRAGEQRGTLRVTARVVEACEIRVPDWVWDHVLKKKAKKAIWHRCKGRVPAHVDFDPPWPHWRDDHRGPRHGRHDRDDRDERHDRDDRHDRDRHDRDRHDRDRDRDHATTGIHDRGDRHDRDDDRDRHRDRDDDRGSRTVWVTITY